MLHPSEHIRARYPNLVKGQRLENAVVVRQEEKIIRRTKVAAVVIRHDSFQQDGNDIELYAHPRYFRIIKEGPEEHFFAPTQVAEQEDGPEENGIPVPQELGAVVDRDDVGIARASGINVDDDNQPAPENLPDPADPSNDVFGNWDQYTGICPRRQASVPNTSARLSQWPRDSIPTKIQLFERLFPKAYIIHTVLDAINASVQGHDVEYWEFLVFLGIWFTMALVQGFQRRDFWSTSPITGSPESDGAPYRFNAYMARGRFESILESLMYTTDEPPEYVDKFWEVRQLLQEWNDNMEQNFISGWLSVLDESMSVWTNMYTCPGFMFVPRKPHPFGNEYHTICDCESGVLYRLELVEGKDCPAERPKPEFDALGKTVGLLLRLTKALWGTGKCLILDSGFCVLKGMAELKKRGVFAAAQIKKRRYWPKYVDGEAIKAHFADKEVGDVACLPGVLDNVPVYIHCMKEPDYITMLMSNYGTIERLGDFRPREWVEDGTTRHATFKYPEIVYRHYKNRHQVDNHNNRRHQPISLEEVWGTKHWPHRVFAFLLAVTEGNMFLMNKTLNAQAEDSILAFRRSFAAELLNNPYKQKEAPLSATKGKRKRTVQEAHDKVSLPRGKKFAGTTIVNASSNYPQGRCECGKRRRTYCSCSPGVYRCDNCFAMHVLSVEMGGTISG